jgi:pterin-4a-carbinolamine dehydratase
LAFGNERVFIDTDSIRVGDDWQARIDQALHQATLLIVVIGPQWLWLQDDYGRRRLDNDEDWVRGEIAHALKEQIKVIPILVQHATLPQKEGLPTIIQNLLDFQALTLHEEHWERDRESLVHLIEGEGFLRTYETVEYPPPWVRPNVLSSIELNEILKRLPAWQIVRGPNSNAKSGEATELTRQFVFRSFEDAIHFMVTATRHISQVVHHPDWTNIWRTVVVRLITWDIGHKPSRLDVELAEYLEELYAVYDPTK